VQSTHYQSDKLLPEAASQSELGVCTLEEYMIFISTIVFYIILKLSLF